MGNSIKTLTLLLISLVCMGGMDSTVQAFPIAEPGTEGLDVIVGSTEPVIATYRGNSASYSNSVYLLLNDSGIPDLDRNHWNDRFLFNNHESPVGSTIDLGSFPIGTKLTFRMVVKNTGRFYDTRPVQAGISHARVQAFWTNGETLISFEDLNHGPYDYNDLSFSLSHVWTKQVSIRKAWLTPDLVKPGDTLHAYAEITGDPAEIGDVTLVLGNRKLASMSDPEGDGMWTGTYKVDDGPGYKVGTKIYVKSPDGRVIAKWPGFTVEDNTVQ